MKSSGALRVAQSKLIGKLEVSTDLGVFLGDTRVRLLEAIDEHGSISQAAKRVPLSYKAAWDAVDAMNNLADQSLVDRSTGGRNGGGTQLTDYGRRVVAMYRAVEAEYQLALQRVASQLGELEAGDVQAFQRLLRRMALRSSARNQFACTVAGLRAGDVEVDVRLRLDAHQELRAVVTRDSATHLGLALGQEVFALVKSSAVLLTTDVMQTSAGNQIWAEVLRIVPGPVNAEVVLGIGGDKTVTAVITHDSVASLGLQQGSRACAVFQCSDVILNLLA